MSCRPGPAPATCRKIRMARRMPRLAITHKVAEACRVSTWTGCRCQGTRSVMRCTWRSRLFMKRSFWSRGTSHLIDPLVFDLVVALNARWGTSRPGR